MRENTPQWGAASTALAGLAILGGLGLFGLAMQAATGRLARTSHELKAAIMDSKGSQSAGIKIDKALAGRQENDAGWVTEDGHSIGDAVLTVAEVEAHGQGAFKIKPPRLYLSSSDGSQPATNGRRYALLLPVRVLPLWWIRAATVFVASAGLLWGLHWRSWHGWLAGRWVRVVDWLSDEATCKKLE